MRKQWQILSVIVVLVAVAGISGCQGSVTQRVEAQNSTETAVVRRGVLRSTVDATGRLITGSETLVAFSSSGRVGVIFVEEGQTVDVAQPLARLETDELELQVAQAEAALAAAEAQWAQLLAPPQQEQVAGLEADLRAMEAQLNAALANRDRIAAGADVGEIAAAEAQLASATAQQKSAFDAHERTMGCRTIKVPAGIPLPDGTILEESEEKKICPGLGAPEEQARYALQAADASLAAARAQLDELQAGADADQLRAAQANVATAVAQRDAARARLDLLLAGATEEQMEIVRASVDDARIALEQARLRLEKATLKAPVAGTVTYLGVTSGEIVNANQPVVALSDLTALEVDLNLDETDVAKVALGQEALVGLDALPGVEVIGEISAIAPVGQSQGGIMVYPVTVNLPPMDSGRELLARAGMTADVSVVTASREDALIVPLRAVQSEEERAYVERLAGDRIEKVAVELGLVTDTEIEIVNGLSEGDVVVVVSRATPDTDTSMPPGPMGLFRTN